MLRSHFAGIEKGLVTARGTVYLLNEFETM